MSEYSYFQKWQPSLNILSHHTREEFSLTARTESTHMYWEGDLNFELIWYVLFQQLMVCTNQAYFRQKISHDGCFVIKKHIQKDTIEHNV